MEFRMLGTLQVLDDDGRDLPLGGAKQRATLAILLLHANQVLSRDRLVAGPWGGAPPPSADQTLKTYVSRLRQVLQADARGQRLQSRPPG